MQRRFRAAGGRVEVDLTGDEKTLLAGLLEVLAGVWLWRGLKQGALLGVVLSAVNAVFWVGFALPIPLIGGPLRILLLMLGWRSLR